MVTVANRYRTWLDLIWEYVHGSVRAFPTAQMSDTLVESFPCALVSWNEGDTRAQRHQMSMVQTIDGWPTTAEIAEVPALMAIHPLLCWYDVTQDPRPLDIRSVPRDAVPTGGAERVTELLSPVGIDRQLAIPTFLSGGHYQILVVGRADDFTDEELDLAGRIQPLLALAQRHATVVGRAATSTATSTGWAWSLALAPDDETAEIRVSADFATVTRAAGDCDLTCRELAVLRLLAEGGTADRISHQLGISPRTVHTHLGSIYRKLDVDGRVNALRQAQRRGLISW